MPKVEVMPYLTWLEEVVAVAQGLDAGEKSEVVDILRALARRVRRSKQPWREHVFALAIARFAFVAALPDQLAGRMPICVSVEGGAIHAYITDSERATFPLGEAAIRLMPSNLLGLVQTIEGFRHEKWLTDEFQAAGMLADAQITLLDEESRLSHDILRLVARCLYGMTPTEPS
jgi:hypothetical protein